MGEIKRVYLGLPEALKNIVRWSDRASRTNPLSHKPGGWDVIVEYHNGKVFGYDWIKYPSNYIERIFLDSVLNDLDDFFALNKNDQIGVVKMKINRIFTRNYTTENYETIAFEEMWNSKSSNDLPWEKFKLLEGKQK